MPGLAFLGLAAWLFIYLLRGGAAEVSGGVWDLLMVAALVCVMLGLICLVIFWQEFRYWIHYSS